MVSKYFMDDYFNKSQKFLFPLLKISEKPTATYLFWDKINESITDYFLLCEYPQKADISHEKLEAVYKTHDSVVYVFNMDDWRDDIEHFLIGAYSKFKGKTKENILKYYGWINKDGSIMHSEEVKKSNLNPHWHVFFYPAEFREEVAQEWVENFKYYKTYEEAMSITKDMTEFCSVYHKDKETLKKDMI